VFLLLLPLLLLLLLLFWATYSLNQLFYLFSPCPQLPLGFSLDLFFQPTSMVNKNKLSSIYIYYIIYIYIKGSYRVIPLF
jgi:hypothetical protein